MLGDVLDQIVHFIESSCF